MPTSITVIDAFTDRPFAGNPAAVCVLDASRDDAWHRAVASELNLSETAFLTRRPDGDWGLRWFTPTEEERLCGHATLASAHHLWESGRHPRGAMIRFHTLSGVLTAAPSGAQIALDFPSEAPTPITVPPGLSDALGARILSAGQNRLDIFAELADETTVRGLSPSNERLAVYDTRGIVVTAQAEAGRPYDFVSRFFAPRCGIAEDPVTGSAHCGLGPWWSTRLGKDSLIGYQASPRGGIVGVTVLGARCRLEGTAVTVWKGELL
ncbi:MAG: PhzF family phenazine biosynthesis protein [Gemmatimonadota bacterium]